MVFTRFLKPEARKGLIDTREAMNVWGILNNCYQIIERIEEDERMIHDLDLKMVSTRIVKHLKQDADQLKIESEKYQIKGPDRGRLPSNWTGNPEVVRDELSAQLTLKLLEDHLQNLVIANRTSLTNDKIRQVFHKMMVRNINDIDMLLKYLKLKGWIEAPPTYQNSPPENKESISCGTAGNLWDHLSRRYDNYRKTEFYHALAHDPDLKIILDLGISKLQEQTILLEEECQKFGIPLPKRPCEVVIAPINTDLVNDDQMYRDLLVGMQGATLLHITAYKQCKLNDRIRKLFQKMINQELDFFELFIKYGKTKGWLNPIPIYKV